MSSKLSTLFFFTAEFPYGKSETFIENEIDILAQHFQSIIIFPYHSSGKNPTRSFPQNTHVVPKIPSESFRTSRIFLKNFFPILYFFGLEWWNSPQKKYILFNAKQILVLLCKGFYDAQFIESHLPQMESRSNSTFYSFWMNDWALALAILKHQNKIPDFIFRVGGFDIYDERHPGNYLPFRYLIYKYVKRVYPNTRLGVDYIQKKQMFPEKITLSYWGTRDRGMNEFSDSLPFRIVSCSNVIPLKRVELIIAILSHLKFKIDWVHFGDGGEMEHIQQLASKLPENISVAFKGQVSNQEVLKFYQQTPVHLFITTSSTEGLPVSIQEAISFGIPIVATAVGGIPEIVNEQTGILIPADFDPKYISTVIDEFLHSEKNSEAFRNSIRRYWEENFEAKNNYRRFCETIAPTPE